MSCYRKYVLNDLIRFKNFCISKRLRKLLSYQYPDTLFAPKFGTRPIRLTPPVRPVSLNGLTGGVSCSWSGNGHTSLTGGPNRSDRWTPSPSRIVKSLRISRCKKIPCGVRPPHHIYKYKGPRPFEVASPNPSLLFTTFISQTLAFPTSCFPCLSQRRSGTFWVALPTSEQP
jgi:hypothetical protein